jgi:hypothetical protein
VMLRYQARENWRCRVDQRKRQEGMLASRRDANR